MVTLSTYASGYPVHYRKDRDRKCPYRARGGCDENEVNALEHGGRLTYDPHNPAQYWWPRTDDFRAEAKKQAKKPIGVATMGALIKTIQKRKNIRAVLWFGHGIKGELQFGSKKNFGRAGIASLPDVSAKFSPNGNITFYACNAGQSRAFFQAMADKLRVPVRGFSTGVKWNLTWSGSSPHRLITSRGISGRLPAPNITCTPR